MKSNKDKIKTLLQYTITSGSIYNGRNHVYGYHTQTIDGEVLSGQRNPNIRLSKLNYDFTNKSVLDIGSNQGGMLFEIADKISYGMGIDYDKRLVNVSNRISKHNNYNIDFYNFDLASEDFNLINDLSRVEKFDTIFLLAVCMWIPTWKDLIKWVHKNSNNCLFETNGKKQQQQDQIDFLKQTYSSVTMLAEQSDDDPDQKKRKLLWCTK
jgi:SAM-dependent methyltransferase